MLFGMHSSTDTRLARDVFTTQICAPVPMHLSRQNPGAKYLRSQECMHELCAELPRIGIWVTPGRDSEQEGSASQALALSTVTGPQLCLPSPMALLGSAPVTSMTACVRMTIFLPLPLWFRIIVFLLCPFGSYW